MVTDYERKEREHHETYAKWCKEIEQQQMPLVIDCVRKGWQGKDWDSEKYLAWLGIEQTR